MYPETSPHLAPAQSRAARGLLNWSQSRLAAEAGISRATVNYFETGQRDIVAQSMGSIRKALETGGVRFLAFEGGAGVALGRMPKT